MTLLGRYIFRNALNAFLACLFALTAVIWVTQALRELDLITGKGQTILIFLLVTGLSLPALVAIIAPVALFIAVVYTLSKLNGDSELIVMNAAGIPPRKVMAPFGWLAGMVAVLVAVMTLYLIPASFQELRNLVTKIRADFVANLVKEGQFTTLDMGITFSYRERSGEALLGIFMQDRRDPARTVVYLAERGQAVDHEGSSYLILEKGSIHRQQPNSRDSSIVAFERYAVDLAAFNQNDGPVVFKPRERSTFDLVAPDPNELYYQWQAGRFRAELHDRLSSWLYPIAMMLIAFAALGEARTTRQGRGLAIAAAVIGVGALRVAGFAASSAVVRSSWGLVGVYGAPLLACALALLVIFQRQRANAIQARLGRLISSVVLPRLPRLKRA